MKTHTWLTPICCIVAAIVLTLCVSAADIVDSGECGKNGDNLTWTLDSDGVLTISGMGAMYDGDSPIYSPWYYGGREYIVTAVINSGVSNIGDYAFLGCTNLKSVTIPDSVTSIGDGAFSNCGLANVTIHNSVTSIGNSAFSNCASLTSVTIGDSVTFIGESAFSGCKNLTSVTISNSVTSIGESAFYNCESLTDITIPDSVISIGDGAFANCGLTSVTIPDSVTSIGGAFGGCHNLKAILVNSNHRYYMSEDGILFSKNRSILVAYPAGKTGVAYEIPDSVTSIGNYAFYRCALTSVTIPDGVTSIGDYAFYHCGLTSVTIPDSMTSIGDLAFTGCDLTSVTIPNGVTCIGSSAFAACKSLTSVTIPNSVTYIGLSAFYNCESLTSATIPNSVPFILNNTFGRCASLTSVTIPDSVTYIGYTAFRDCVSLTDVYYGGSPAQWSEAVDFGNDELESVTVHYNAQDIGIGIRLTDKNGKTADPTKDVLGDNNELTASFAAVDPDAVTSSGLAVASVFWVFYDENGLLVSLESKEIDLSNPQSLSLVTSRIQIPKGAKKLKFFILGDGFDPRRAVRMIESPDA